MPTQYMKCKTFRHPCETKSSQGENVPQVKPYAITTGNHYKAQIGRQNYTRRAQVHIGADIV